MKKIIALLLALVLVFSLVACNGGGAGDDATPTPAGDTVCYNTKCNTLVNNR